MAFAASLLRLALLVQSVASAPDQPKMEYFGRLRRAEIGIQR
jgi:hypothetical protein